MTSKDSYTSNANDNLKLPTDIKHHVTSKNGIVGAKNSGKSKVQKSIKNKLMSLYRTNFMQRSIFTVVMILVFALIVIKLDNYFLMIIVYILKTLCLKEILSVATRRIAHKTGRRLPILNYCMIAISDCYMIGKILGKKIQNDFIRSILGWRIIFCFSLHIAAIIYFVMILAKEESTGTKFYYLGLTYFVIHILGISSTLCMLNISYGKIWFVYPSALVITNDICAYIVGKFFGKTPLIRLSPKKTWEGFMGGFIGTFIIGLLVPYFVIKSGGCQEIPEFLLDETNFNVLFTTVALKKLYLHAIPFIFFASFCAPFGGFLASGYKRAFNVKDFSHVIPGHGGLVDRLDCHFMMGIFTNVYFYTFFMDREMTVEKVYNIAINGLNQEQLGNLVEKILDRIKK